MSNGTKYRLEARDTDIEGIVHVKIDRERDGTTERAGQMHIPESVWRDFADVFREANNSGVGGISYEIANGRRRQ